MNNKTQILINTLLELISEADGYYMTDNKDIHCDDILIGLRNETLSIMYDNDELHIPVSEISELTFEFISTMVVATIQSTGRDNLLIHLL